MQWNPNKWWMIFVRDFPKMEALQWTNQREIWPILLNLIFSPFERYWTIDKDYCWTGNNGFFTLDPSRGNMWNLRKPVWHGWSSTHPYGRKRKQSCWARGMESVPNAIERRMICIYSCYARTPPLERTNWMFKSATNFTYRDSLVPLDRTTFKNFPREYSEW